MNKEFVTYEQALALKELGFDEPCFGSYVRGNEYKDWTLYFKGGTFFAKDYPEFITAPLYQQAFRWFREKYGLCNFINFSGDGFCSGWEDLGNNEHGFENFKTYEEAESACLDKLIEISFLILADGKTHLPSKGDKFIKEDGRIILNNGEK